MLSDDQKPCTSPNSGKATSTNTSPQPPSINISPGQFTTIVLPDEVLLEIFACYVEESQTRGAWHVLACVCQRWRSVVLGSPRRLNLRIFCSERTPMRKNLDFLPPFPIVLTADYYRRSGEDNIFATPEHHDRVCDIEIRNISSSLWEKVLPLLQKQFPMLTDLCLRYTDEITSVVPDLFLGGSAPRLRKLYLEGIPFPGLPKLLSSCAGLVHLELCDIPDPGYISADAIVTCLSTFTRLKLLKICFESPRPRSEWGRRHTSPQTRTLLPCLAYFMFKGVGEYLKDIVDRIDAPLLDNLRISFFHQPIFDTPRLAQFISRTPKFKACSEVRVHLGSYDTSVHLISFSKTSHGHDTILRLEYYYGYWQPDLRLSSFVQLCASSFPQDLISVVKNLNIVGGNLSSPPGHDEIYPSL